MTAALVRWACLSLCYLALAGTLSKAEGVTAALTGAFATLLSLGLRARGERRLRLRGRWALVSAQIGWLLLRDTGRVAATLVRALLKGHRGHVLRDGQAAARPVGSGIGHRAATAFIASLSPDTIALETDAESLPLHQLSRRRAP